ncbi:MAG: hypothetical protein U0637_09400 [Phycisphaerales bacterium]
MTVVSHTGQSHHPALRSDNITFAPGAGGGVSMGMMGLGFVLLIAALGIGFSGAGGMPLVHALAAVHVGVMSVLAMCLGATFFLMVFHLMGAGWTSTLRRQFENVAAFLPFAWLGLAVILGIELAKGGVQFAWLKPEHMHNPVLVAKSGFYYWPGHMKEGALPLFFILRTAIYGAFWTFLVSRLRGLSLAQDRTGDRALSARAKFMCAWGMPLFALSIAFCAFDYLMSLDYSFFSTMWGVYYFAGAAFSGVAVVTFVLARLVKSGKVQGAVTSEHFHDLGKIMFSFTVFWAYISFCQYFLYWYANIPEETAFYVHRSGPEWKMLGVFLMIGHFGLPFVYLVSRDVKKNLFLISVACLWFVLVHVADIFWIVRPMTYAGGGQADPMMSGIWLDLLGIVGVLLVFAGFLVKKVSGGVLVAVNDPFIQEGLEHRNYV